MLLSINLSTNLMSTSYKKERNKSYYSNCFIPKNDLCIQYKIVEIKENTNDIGHYYFDVLKRKKKNMCIVHFIFLFFNIPPIPVP